ncbi:MAG: hypothetical protein JWM21_4211 [Acidobacteria bacterium]|nr:hypothetical protein [Acidobacteriota bacterium]
MIKADRPSAFIRWLCAGIFLLSPAAFQAQKPELVVETGHSSWVSSVMFSPDGKTLVSGGQDDRVVLWDVATGKELRAFSHNQIVESVCFSPDGKTVASGSADNTIKLWNFSDGTLRRSLSANVRVLSVTFSPDGATLASSGADHLIQLWDVDNGTLRTRLSGHSGWVGAVGFSRDGHTLASGSDDGTIRLWDLKHLENPAKVIPLPSKAHVKTVAFSPDGLTLASGSDDGAVNLWDVASRTVKLSLSGQPPMAFAPDGKSIAATVSEKTIKVWDSSNGALLATLPGNSDALLSLAFSPDGQTISSGGKDKTIRLWDVGRQVERLALIPHARRVHSIALSSDGQTLVSGGSDATIKVWDLSSSGGLRSFKGHSNYVLSVALSADGKTVASGSDDNTIRLWDAQTGAVRQSLPGRPPVAFSPDGKVLAYLRLDGMIRLIDAASLNELNLLDATPGPVRDLVFSSDGANLASAGDTVPIKLWDLSTGKVRYSLSGNSPISFSRDSKILASATAGSDIKLWDVPSGTELFTLKDNASRVTALAFAADGKLLAGGSEDATIKLWDVTARSVRQTLTGHQRTISSLVFGPEDRTLVSASWDSSIKLWQTAGGHETATLSALDDKDWAVVDSEGRFDASAGGMEIMHWVVRNEPIDLSQLKARYYEPHLLTKLTGFNKEPRRDISNFQDVKLFPAVEYDELAPNRKKLSLTLINRDGGIGKVQIFVNGREVVADARGANPDPNLRKEKREIDLDQFKRFMVPGEENVIEVVTHNAEGYLASRGAKLVFSPPAEAKVEPSLFALVVGVSTYRKGGNLHDLTFAAKDAGAMAVALETAGNRLFPARTTITQLSTAGDKPERQPSKQNIIAALKEFAGKAKSTDILLLYFAGHGVSFGGQDGDFYFLTSDASTADLKDIELRDSTAFSSQELAKLILSIPANKQVMILDTCASGRLIEELTKSRSVDSSTIRAWDRMKDRTGLWILAGSAADAVSYESSRYGEGVLTYSLLKGMKVDFDKAMRKAEGDSAPEYVDVSALFNYSADVVPLLAQGIGGIQKPLIASKRDARSFDIGRINATDRAIIPYTIEKPVFLRADFQLEGRPRDTLDLGGKVDAQLREKSARGLDAPLVFWDLPQHPGAYRIAGRYVVNGTHVSVKVFVSTFLQSGVNVEEKDVGQPFTIEGDIADVNALVTRILEQTDKLVAVK